MTRRKVLIFSVDILPSENLPASSGGIRAQQIIEALTAHGHEVVVSTSTTTYLARAFSDRLTDETRRLSYTSRPQSVICREIKPDVVVFASNWSAADGDWWPECPVVVDLCGPVTLELALSNRTGLTGITAAFQRKVEVLSKADLLICAGRRQEWYFRQAAALAGFDPMKPLPLQYVPLAVDEDLITARTYPSEPVLVYAGGLYPWQDPRFCLEGALDAIRRNKQGRLRWYGGAHSTGKSESEREALFRKLLSESPQAEVKGFLPLPDLREALMQCSLSLELMAPNLERELALTTRTILNMALGLPILYGEYAELSPLINEYQAGWIVPNGDTAALAKALDEALTSPAEIERRGLNAQRLVRERFTVREACRPLVEFVNEPAFRSNKQRVAAGLGALTPGELRLLRVLRGPFLRPFRALAGRFFRNS